MNDDEALSQLQAMVDRAHADAVCKLLGGKHKFRALCARAGRTKAEADGLLAEVTERTRLCPPTEVYPHLQSVLTSLETRAVTLAELAKAK